jgi:hypothetical protein
MPCGLRRATFLLGAAALSLPPTAALAQAVGLEDLVGARAGQAEAALRARGYEIVRTEPGEDRRYAYWWSQARRQCVAIAVMDGRLNSIAQALPADCERPAGVTPRPAPEDRPVLGAPDYPPPPVLEPRPPRPTPPAPPPGVMVDGRAVELGVVCFGDGQKPRTMTAYGWTWNPDRDRYDSAGRIELQTQAVDAALTIQIWEDGGRIRLPRALIPPINSRGDHGWWDLTEVAVSRERITARYRLNSLNKPALTIDRRSGRIIIQGVSSYGFRGECELLDHGERRRF